MNELISNVIKHSPGKAATLGKKRVKDEKAFVQSVFSSGKLISHRAASEELSGGRACHAAF